MIFFVNVNSDMTKYLPAKSQMKQGLSIITEEFGGADIAQPGIKVMFGRLSAEERAAMQDSLNAYPDVNKLNVILSDDGEHTLYQLYVDDSVDQKKLGKQLRRSLPEVEEVETSQDGATPPISVMVIAAVLIIAILLFMCQSWVEPFVYLAATGMGILLNMGTNALLPSVSITTHSIAAILQLVLSLDYCIVMTNRYRQEKKIRATKVEAANAAIKRAFAPIMSSAMTTVVGLLMLCFMRLRIGMDMGVVLAKGVVCSLICTFTVLPSLLMLLQTAIEKSHKRTFVIPTQRLGRFATSHKIPLAIFALLLFCASFYLSRQTTIFFSANADSKIEKVFPKTNPLVIIYNTADDAAIPALADSVRGRDYVKSIISYPTLLQQQYTSRELTHHLQTMAIEFGDFVPASGSIEMLTPEMMDIVYYMKSGAADTLRVGFPALTDFITTYCVSNPMFASVIDDDMRSQMALLGEMTQEQPQAAEPAGNDVPATEVVTATVADSAAYEQALTDSLRARYAMDAPSSQLEGTVAPVNVNAGEPQAINPAVVGVATYSLVDFMNKLYVYRPDALTMDFRSLADTVSMRRIMTIQEMSDYVGSSVTQTRLVFNYDTRKRKSMPPIDYMHILTDDLFKRPALNGMITQEQKQLVRMRTTLMDLANKDAQMDAQQLAHAASSFGIEGITASVVERLMAKPVAATQTVSPAENGDSASALQELSVAEQITALTEVRPVEAYPEDPMPVIHIQKPKRKPTRAEREADRKAALFLELMYGGKTYDAAEMADMFSQLGQTVEPGMVSLLYTYYGSVNCPDTTYTLSIEQLFTYVSDTLVNDPRTAAFIDDSSRQMIIDAKGQLQGGVGMLHGQQHSLMVILTDLPAESDETYAFVDDIDRYATSLLSEEYFTMGESVMYSEMKKGFNHEMMIVTILTILAIFLIVAVTFRSIVVPTILVLTVMTAVYVNVVFCGIVSGEMLYLAYLIVQSILMGATIDYGILFANYYREKRQTLPANEAIFEAYHGSIRTIMTSGLIMVVAPAAMAILTDNVMISNIVGCLAIGAFVAIVLILVVLPGVLVVFDRWVVHNAVPKRRQE